jgi:hypothetical protein
MKCPKCKKEMSKYREKNDIVTIFKCLHCGFVPFKDWYSRTKKYGGTREEWEKIYN